MFVKRERKIVKLWTIVYNDQMPDLLTNTVSQEQANRIGNRNVLIKKTERHKYHS